MKIIIISIVFMIILAGSISVPLNTLLLRVSWISSTGLMREVGIPLEDMLVEPSIQVNLI